MRGRRRRGARHPHSCLPFPTRVAGGGVSKVPLHILPAGSDTARSEGKEGFAHSPGVGPVTFEDEGSDSLGLNCMVATWRPAGEQLLGFTQLLEAPSVPNYRLFKAFDLSTHPPGPQQMQIRCQTKVHLLACAFMGHLGLLGCPSPRWNYVCF